MGPRHRTAPIWLAFCATFALSTAALAQPFGAWLVSSSASATKYVEVPSSSDLNPITAITIEAWVSNTAISASDCRSIIGKDWHTSYWLGICGNTFRSYLFGSLSNRDGGTVPNGQWTHVAVTYDGTNRRHYINGELVSTFPETGSLPASAAALRIASDVSWTFSPSGAINEVRLWNVARTVDQIRGAINTPITTVQPGLVAVWSDGLHDVIGAHNGTNVGGVGFLTFPVALGCTPTATSLCLSGRFSVTVSWRTSTGTTGVGTVVPGASADSGLFWFFGPAAWEVLAKTVNGCALNNRHWAFAAATTDVFYRLEFTDVRGGAAKIYFNYPGVPSPAVTDAAAFATCP
jgi:hypothetical protein